MECRPIAQRYGSKPAFEAPGGGLAITKSPVLLFTPALAQASMLLRVWLALVNDESVCVGVVDDGHPADGAFEGLDDEFYAAGAKFIDVGVEVIDFEGGGDAE